MVNVQAPNLFAVDFSSRPLGQFFPKYFRVMTNIYRKSRVTQESLHGSGVDMFQCKVSEFSLESLPISCTTLFGFDAEDRRDASRHFDPHQRCTKDPGMGIEDHLAGHGEQGLGRLRVPSLVEAASVNGVGVVLRRPQRDRVQ